jgi:predicted Rdx family selenoprotein
VTLDENALWDRAEKGRFPQPKELKQLIRDKVAPSKDLGHSDTDQEERGMDPMDDDEAEEMRKFFGVM